MKIESLMVKSNPVRRFNRDLNRIAIGICPSLIGWQVTLCDPIWQVTSRSCEMEYPLTTMCSFTFYLLLKTSINVCLNAANICNRCVNVCSITAGGVANVSVVNAAQPSVLCHACASLIPYFTASHVQLYR